MKGGQIERHGQDAEPQWRDFGNALRKHRQDRCWSHKDLRDKLREQLVDVFSQGTISKWEHGLHRPSADTVEVLEDIFGLPRGTFLALLRYPVEGRSASVERNTNWIEDHYAKHGLYPPLPKPLDRLVSNYVTGQPVSKDMVVLYADIGTWNEIKSIPGLEKKWREFLEWLGQDPDVYEYEVRRRGPPRGNPNPLTFR